MASIDFRQALLDVEQWGLSDVLLPFLLIFTILFAVLSKSKILGDKKAVHVAVSLTVALIVVIPHVLGIYPADRDAVVIINTIIPSITLVIVGILTMLLLIGLFGGGPSKHHGATFSYIVIFAILFNVFFNEMYPNIAPIVLWLTLVAAIWGVFGSHKAAEGTFIPGWITIIAFIVIFFIVIFAMGYKDLPVWLEWMRDPSIQAIVIVVLVLLAVASYISKSDK